MDRLAEIKARCEAATPAPWYGEADRGVYLDVKHDKPIFETGCGCCTSSDLATENADFIAHSREDIPYLLSLIAEQAAKIKELEEEITHRCEKCGLYSLTDDACKQNADLTAANASLQSRLSAAIADIERANQIAEEANTALNEIRSDDNIQYGDYLQLFDAMSEIVNWKHEDVWQGVKEG